MIEYVSGTSGFLTPDWRGLQAQVDPGPVSTMRDFLNTCANNKFDQNGVETLSPPKFPCEISLSHQHSKSQ